MENGNSLRLFLFYAICWVFSSWIDLFIFILILDVALNWPPTRNIFTFHNSCRHLMAVFAFFFATWTTLHSFSFQLSVLSINSHTIRNILLLHKWFEFGVFPHHWAYLSNSIPFLLSKRPLNDRCCVYFLKQNVRILFVKDLKYLKFANRYKHKMSK